MTQVGCRMLIGACGSITVVMTQLQAPQVPQYVYRCVMNTAVNGCSCPGPPSREGAARYARISRMRGKYSEINGRTIDGCWGCSKHAQQTFLELQSHACIWIGHRMRSAPLSARPTQPTAPHLHLRVGLACVVCTNQAQHEHFSRQGAAI